MGADKLDDQSFFMKPGEDLLVIGSVASEGTRRLIQEKWELLREHLPEHYLREELEHQEPSAQELVNGLLEGGNGITAHCMVGEGGILNAMWELTGACEAGVRFWLRKIPIRQATIEVCERLGATPYRLLSGNCYLLAAEHGTPILEICSEAGIPAEIIGYVKPGIARELRHGEETGYLERPREDELYRILGGA